MHSRRCKISSYKQRGKGISSVNVLANIGFGRMGRAGSCALVCVVANNKVYSANAGDSLGLIIEQDENNKMKYVEINRELNANKAEER